MVSSETIYVTISGSPELDLPVNYVFSSSNSSVTFSNPSGSITSAAGNSATIQVVITAPDITTLTNSTHTLTVTDNSGCPGVTNITVSNPCASLAVSSLSVAPQDDVLVVSALGSGGDGTYTYNFEYDENYFTVASKSLFNTATSIALKVIKENGIPVQTPATVDFSVEIVDGKGCTVSDTTTYTLPAPVTFDVLVLPIYDAVRNIWTRSFSLDVSNIQNLTIYNLIGSVPAGISVLNQVSGFNYYLEQDSGLYTVLYQVINAFGRISNTSEIRTVVEARPASLPVLDPVRRSSACERNIDMGELSISAEGTSEGRDYFNAKEIGIVNWKSWTIETAPVYGSAALNADLQIVYTVSSVATPAIPDMIEWSVLTTETVPRKLFRKTFVDRLVKSAPGYGGLPTFEYWIAGESLTVDVEPDLTGDIAIETLRKGDPAYSSEYGVSIVPNTGQVTISTLRTDDVVGTVARNPELDIDNVEGTTTTFSPMVITYLGNLRVSTTSIDLTCTDLTYTLEDILFGAQNAPTVTYTEPAGTYTGLGGTIGAAGELDFTGIAAGTYVFRITVDFGAGLGSRIDTFDITVVNPDPYTFVITSGVDNTDGTWTIQFPSVNALSASQLSYKANNISHPLTGFELVSPGVYEIEGYYVAAGNNTIVVTLSTPCGDLITDTVVINNVSGTILV